MFLTIVHWGFILTSRQRRPAAGLDKFKETKVIIVVSSSSCAAKAQMQPDSGSLSIWDPLRLGELQEQPTTS
jgi:hypothetical protein